MPEDYQRFISNKDYQQVVKLCCDHLKAMGVKVVQIKGGTITIKGDEGNEKYYHLDNLVRRLSPLDKPDWSAEIRTHFEKLQDQTSAYEFFYKDFEYTSKYLKIQVKADDALPNPDQLMLRVDFPGTYTCLVFDFEDQFSYINREKAGEWNKSDQVLFDIALQQVAKEEMEVKEYELGNRFQTFTVFSGDFSACYLLEFEENLPFARGKFGSLIAIPTRGSAFIHPITSPDVMDIMSILYPEVEHFYHEDPGSITLNLYWYYQGEFHLFPAKNNEEGKLLMSLPQRLNDLLE